MKERDIIPDMSDLPCEGLDWSVIADQLPPYLSERILHILEKGKYDERDYEILRYAEEIRRQNE